MEIGQGESIYWWIFKTYWRIVVSWGPNYTFEDDEYKLKKTKMIITTIGFM